MVNKWQRQVHLESPPTLITSYFPAEAHLYHFLSSVPPLSSVKAWPHSTGDNQTWKYIWKHFDNSEVVRPDYTHEVRAVDPKEFAVAGNLGHSLELKVKFSMELSKWTTFPLTLDMYLREDWKSVIQRPPRLGSWPKKLGNSWRDTGMSVSHGYSVVFPSFLRKGESGLCNLWETAVAAVKTGGTDKGSGQNQEEPPSHLHEPGLR